MQRFYRFYAESHEGETGDYLVEVVDDLITRQIFVFGNQLLWAAESGQADHRYALTDQPEWNESDEAAEPITEEHFEELWTRSRTQ